jgi:lipopolysaccharide export LptBFGC system permease protein LptF
LKTILLVYIVVPRFWIPKVVFTFAIACVTYFWVLPQKKRRKYKKKNIVRRKQKNNSSEKRMPEHPENDQKLIEEVQKQKKLKFDGIFFIDESSINKENSI